jgi:hypothetical protein
MSLDEQLAELLGQLGVILEDADGGSAEEHTGSGDRHHHAEERATGGKEGQAAPVAAFSADPEVAGIAEISLFQTSREHYGVFYRLDLIAGVPQLRIFMPEEEGALKMRCYLVRPEATAPIRLWFRATRSHDGSAAYDEAREATEQHLLFAAGESLKQLFWAGDPDDMRFPAEVTVERLA